LYVYLLFPVLMQFLQRLYMDMSGAGSPFSQPAGGGFFATLLLCGLAVLVNLLLGSPVVAYVMQAFLRL